MDAKFCRVSLNDYGTFHAIDRMLYNVLAIQLWRDPYESVQALALWLWIERRGFKNFIFLLISLPHMLIDKYADEALTCAKCINNPQFVFSAEVSGASAIPLTSNLFKEKISLRYFHENRATVLKEIRKIVSEVCAVALQDLIAEAVREHTAYESLHKSFSNLGFVGGSSTGNHVAGASAENRTMFITFSKGYPVSESEVRGFFTKLFGNCIEAFYMQPVNPHEQALYARVIFSNPAVIDFILNGLTKAKFTINGKHLWMRKFVPKRRSPHRTAAAAGLRI